VTAVKNEGGMLPLSEPGNSCWYVLAAGRFSMQGRELMGAVQARAPQAKVTLLDPQLPETEFTALAGSAAQCGSVVLATYVAAAANRGNAALAGNYPGFVERVLAAGRPVAMVSLGNPYLLRAYPAVAAYLATFSTAPLSESAAVKAVLGEIEVDGKLPVSIPGLATVGFGIKIEKRK
jgi:beta-N-acetylhexosaminidase